jgi:hypothetical protein
LNSEMIQEINHAFRHRSEILELISYYESQGMQAIGVSSTYSLLISQVIVPKDSETLGLPGERTSALNGNHLEITKYSSKADDNFIRVSGNIARLVQKIGHADILSTTPQEAGIPSCFQLLI